ncbi:hypothetical protein EYF80_047261 [Liparis tanakae]|uniref:Uncharacterized protein n=1 Tax=Liparis tanakae TaxID=230148 RepID=A0A4Z2FMS9_9TELE|nr:hypothetical protein EYF80_047261 [Liparis tanakae]
MKRPRLSTPARPPPHLFLQRFAVDQPRFAVDRQRRRVAPLHRPPARPLRDGEHLGPLAILRAAGCASDIRGGRQPPRRSRCLPPTQDVVHLFRNINLREKIAVGEAEGGSVTGTSAQSLSSSSSFSSSSSSSSSSSWLCTHLPILTRLHLPAC